MVSSLAKTNGLHRRRLRAVRHVSGSATRRSRRPRCRCSRPTGPRRGTAQQPATSDASPARPIGMPARTAARISSVSLPAVMSVAMKPGQIALTRTLSGREFPRHRLGQAEHARLRGRIVRAAEDAAAALRRDRAEIDDAARLLLPHGRDHRLAHVERAAQVHVEHRVVVLRRDVHDLQRLGDAGIVDQHVDPPPARRSASSTAAGRPPCR